QIEIKSKSKKSNGRPQATFPKNFCKKPARGSESLEESHDDLLMKKCIRPPAPGTCICLALALGQIAVLAAPMGTAFTYHGRLTDGGGPATGNYDLNFSLSDSASRRALVGTPPTITLAPVAVSNGLFTVALDFGGLTFAGDGRWLEITVRTNGAVSPPTILAPRQPLTPSPYALFASGAASAESVPWTGL